MGYEDAVFSGEGFELSSVGDDALDLMFSIPQPPPITDKTATAPIWRLNAERTHIVAPRDADAHDCDVHLARMIESYVKPMGLVLNGRYRIWTEEYESLMDLRVVDNEVSFRMHPKRMPGPWIGVKP